MGEYERSRRTVPLPSDWPAIRRMILLRDRRRCMWGVLPGEGEPGQCSNDANEVDHMGPPDNHDPALLRAICTLHHRKRTSAQANAARREKLKSNGGHFGGRPRGKHPGMR
jgi:5-methylcytosine-specific restriction enzyme A